MLCNIFTLWGLDNMREQVKKEKELDTDSEGEGKRKKLNHSIRTHAFA